MPREEEQAGALHSRTAGGRTDPVLETASQGRGQDAEGCVPEGAPGGLAR